METQFQEFLTIETKKETISMQNLGRYAAWIIQCDGVPIPMDPTPTEKGAHARAKAHFFGYGISSGMALDKDGWREKNVFKSMAIEEKAKQFKEWYKTHCKAVKLL